MTEPDPKMLGKLRILCEKAKIELSSLNQTMIELDERRNVNISRHKLEQLCQEFFRRCLPPIHQALEDAHLSPTDIQEIVLVGGATRMPRIRQLLQECFPGKTLNCSVNPDEAVAYGAAVQGEILTHGENTLVKDLLLLDVNSLSLGLETQGGIMTPVIPRNSGLPASKSQVFSTVEANQTHVLIKVFEGERKFTKDNHLLGVFELSGIRPSPRGVPRIEVGFEVSVDGILQVSAVDKDTGLTNQITISPKDGRLSEHEIQQMIQEADQFRAEDELRKDALDRLLELEKNLLHCQMILNQPEYNQKLESERINQTNQYLLDALEWVDQQRESRISREIIDQKRILIDQDLKEINYLLYSHKVERGGKEKEENLVDRLLRDTN